MSLTLIAAMTTNRVIGLNNTLPWKQKNDLQRFKSLTYNKKIIMGHKTFESLGNKPLPNRDNLVLTRKLGQELMELHVDKPKNLAYRNAASLDWYRGDSMDETFVIGGEQIYTLAMPKAEKLIITELDCELEGDAFFPEIDMNIWKSISTERYVKDADNEYDYRFITYVRK